MSARAVLVRVDSISGFFSTGLMAIYRGEVVDDLDVCESCLGLRIVQVSMIWKRYTVKALDVWWNWI